MRYRPVGVIARARLYDRALSADEVAASAGVVSTQIPESEISAALNAEQRARRGHNPRVSLAQSGKGECRRLEIAFPEEDRNRTIRRQIRRTLTLPTLEAGRFVILGR